MINNIIKFSVKNRLLIILISIVLVFLGLRSFKRLSIDALPDITNTQVQINTSTNGLVPEEIERMITFPIEYSMNGIPGVDKIRSISRFGISQVTVIFDDEISILQARQLVSEKLQSINLPENIKPEMGPISTGLGEVFHYAIQAKNIEQNEDKRLIQLMELRSIQDWYIKPRLLTVKGVTEVNTIGGFSKQYYIQPNIELMTKYGLHFDDIERAIKNTNINVGGGYIQQSAEQLLVRGVGLLKNFEDIENVVVKRLSSYKVIKIKDIAKVKFDKEVRTGGATLNGEESIIGTAFMLLGENSRTVSRDINKRLKDIRSDLPDWVELKVLYNRSNMVNATLGTVEHNLFMGAGLVILFLLLLVGNLRAAIITSIVIPISLLITFILMRYFNVSGNLMSLGALDFGIIIDGAVIVVENCVRKLRNKSKEFQRELTRDEVRNFITEATIEIRSAAGFGELIVIIAFVPLFALSGIEGKMFGPMAQTFIMALCAALILSFTFVPALASFFLSGKESSKDPWLMQIFDRMYAPVLLRSLKRKGSVILLALLTLLGGGLLFKSLGAEFIPTLDEGDIAIQFIRPANINTQSSIELQKISENIINSFSQVENVFARTGASEVATDPMGVNISDSYVMLRPINEWDSSSPIKTKSDLIKAIKQKLDKSVPGQVTMFSQPVELRFNELLEGTRADISIKIYGDDLDKLIDISKELAAVISKVSGAGEVESESKGKSPMIEYRPKTEELAQLGVTGRPVLDAISTAIGGKKIGQIYEGVKTFPIITRLSDRERKDIKTINQLPVGISEGFTVPINKVAYIDFKETFSSVVRENSQRRIAVLVNPSTRDVDSFVKQAKQRIAKDIKLPNGYYIEWGGSFENLEKAKERLSIIIPLTIIIIFALLFSVFKSFSQVLLIFSCAPMALVGGVIGLKIFSLPFSISAAVGFIALLGISILNGVVLVSYFNRLYNKNRSLDDLILQGSKSRLRPVLMTALTDIFGFLPMMFSSGLGAEVQRPLATVVVGGIISATILTLIVLPSAYGFFIKYLQDDSVSS